jgi:predicted ester cyclase
MADTTGSMDRVSRLRRMIEEGDKTDLYSPNFVSNTPWHIAEAKGATRSGKSPSFAATLFSDVKIKVEDAVEEGDKVVIRWRLRGTWSKPFAGVKPTGKPVIITGINIYYFAGDRLIRQDGEVDVGSFVQQAIAAGVNPQACAESLRDLGRPPEISQTGVGGI